MDLELEPLDDDEQDPRLLPAELREQMRQRIKPIADEALAVFDEARQQEIKVFLLRLVTLSEHINHDMQDRSQQNTQKEHLHKLHKARLALFAQAGDVVKAYAQLVDISPVEPWLEWETFLHLLQVAMQQDYFATRNEPLQSGAGKKSINNPFLMQLELEGDEQQLAASHGRYASGDIEKLIFHFSLKQLTAQLTLARRIITGDIWEREYDL